MSKKKSSLEDFIENYLKNKRLTNSADTIDEYRAKNFSDYRGEYARGMERAYAEKRKSEAGYGKNAERIFTSGLARSGYAERQNGIAERGYENRLTELLADKSKNDEAVKQGYSKYLKGYEKNQSSIMKSVRGELAKNRIIDKDTAYEYALMAGLSEDRAKEVSIGMYSALRDTIIAELLDRVITYRLDPRGAAELARQYGLDDADTAYVEKEAERLGGRSYTDDGTLEYLENQSDKVTPSFK